MRNLEQLVTELFERYAHAKSKDDLIAKLKSGIYGDAIPYLASYLKHPDEDIQTHALDAMMRIDRERATDYALPLLSQADWQFSICYWLAKSGGSERAIIPLTEVLRSSPDPDTRFMAAFALKEMGDERAIPALEHAQRYDQGVEHDGHSISEMAAEAIEAISLRTRM